MILPAALVLEWAFGDPPDRWHPVAWFGRWAGWCEARLYADDATAGRRAWLLAVGAPLALAGGLHALLGGWFDALLLWSAIGWRSLLEHVRAVLEADDADAVRAVAGIVSRETAAMDGEAARRAALESLAENASDAVVAPLFWFLLLGAPGAAAYRMINTLDAMWGYRNARYRRFGRMAARADDAANWLPARVTAAAFVFLGWVAGRGICWRDVRAQADTHASPNAGFPEATLAWAADVRLGGPVVRDGAIDARPWYGPEGARAASEAAADALRLVQRALLALAGAAVVVDALF